MARGSIHRASWPAVDELARSTADDWRSIRRRGRGARGDPQGEERGEALDAHRRDARSWCAAPAAFLDALRPALGDVRDAGRVIDRRRSSSRPTSSRSTSRSPTTTDAGEDRPVRRRAWLDAHVNLETGVGVPAAGWGREASPGGRARAPADGPARLPAARVPGDPLTGTNGKTSVARMTAALLEAAGLSIGSYTSPHLQRVNERMVWNGEADRRRHPRRAAAWRWRRSRNSSPTLRATSRSSPPPRCGGSATSRSTPRSSRWGSAAPDDATNVVDAAVAVVTNVSIDHVEYIGPDARRHRQREGGHREAGSRPLVLGETDPALVPHFLAAVPTGPRARRADFGVPATGSRSVVASSTSSRRTATYRRRVPRAARCAPGRQRRGRARRGRVAPRARARTRAGRRRVR